MPALEEDDLLVFGKDGDGFLVEEDLAAVVAELANAKQVVLKVGHDLAVAAGRVGRLSLADAVEVWTRPEASPTWDVGACGLMSQMGLVEVTYVSLAPMLKMAVLEMEMLGGAALQLGREV